MGELLQKLNLKKRLTMRGYQETVVSDIISKFGLYTPYVLGSCPGSGKTEMSIEAMIRLMEFGKINRVLVLAHSTNVLKNNFYERLMEYFEEGVDVDVMRGQKNYNYNARIQVMIPQNINHVIGKFDLIITDEAQHNVLAEGGNYSKIVEMVEPKFQLLLTGTPSKFVLENNIAEQDDIELPYHINTVGMDMVGFEHFHNVRFDLIKSAYGFTSEDYNQYRDLSTDVDFSFKDTEKTVNNVIIGVVRNIALRNGITLPKDADFVLEGKKLIQSGKFGKTLIMCRSIEQANQVSKIISKLFEVKVRVSQSKNDSDSSNLDKFKKNQFEFLCVVNRAREGYDDNKVVNLIDITMTHNIDLIYQMFCRVVRLDKDNSNTKLYIKVTSNAEGMPEYTQQIMTAALMLGATENLSKFNGRNFRGLVMPRVERLERDEDDGDEDDDIVVDGVVDIVDGEGNVVRRRRVNDLMALDLIQMFTSDNVNLISGNDRYAMTTLGESLSKLDGIDFLSPEETFQICVDNELISRPKYSSYRDENTHLNLYLQPWDVTEESSGDYFNRVKDKLGITMLSPEETFQICVDNELISVIRYLDYKENSDLNIYANPWKQTNESSADYFKRVRFTLNIDSGEYLSSEEIFQICVNNGLVSLPKYLKYREENKHLNLSYHPERILNISVSEYFKKIKEALGINDEFISEMETFQICVDNELTNNPKYKKYRIDNHKLNLSSQPWKYTNETSVNYFNRVKNKLGVDDNYVSEVDTFQLCIVNKLINTTIYKIFREENKALKLHSTPWRITKETGFNYFKRVRDKIKELSETTRQYRPAYLGKFSEMNKKWNTTNSKNNHKRLNSNPKEWKEYHKLYTKLRESWGSDIPYKVIGAEINKRPDWVVGDFGCGENLLSKEIKNKVHAFDHIAINESVTSCDVTDVPLHNNVLDVAVFSLSLMGTNYKEYFEEAYRVLKPMGLIMIAEPATRWEDREGELKGMLEESGFKLTGDIKHTDRFIYINGIKC